MRKLCCGLSGDTVAGQITKQLSPKATDAFAAVVMVDVSGYSKLTAALAERGPVGAELLSKTMKGYLDQVFLFGTDDADYRSNYKLRRRHCKICRWGFSCFSLSLQSQCSTSSTQTLIIRRCSCCLLEQ